MTVESIKPLSYDDLCPICGTVMEYKESYYGALNAWVCPEGDYEEIAE